MRAQKDTITRLLKTARGQMDGILRMIEEDRYCVDISNQLMATDAILHRANKEILRAHMRGCVAEALKAPGADGEGKIEELVELLDKITR